MEKYKTGMKISENESALHSNDYLINFLIPSRFCRNEVEIESR